jgi:phage-related holin
MKKETVNMIVAVLGTYFTALFGIWDTALAVVALFMTLESGSRLLCCRDDIRKRL